ncbi:MAG: hypothetical protein O3C23_01510 [bacterium]|nr:hypothetical protein [bacterium]
MQKKKPKAKKVVKKKVAVKKKVVTKKKPLKPGHSLTSRHGGLKVRARERQAVVSRPIGRVSHYFDKIKVAAIKLKAPLKKGDTIRIEGGTMTVKVKISSMQKDHKPIALAKAKDEIGVKISKVVREGYRVFKA